MGAYVIRRLLWIPVTVILVSMVVFLLVPLHPGQRRRPDHRGNSTFSRHRRDRPRRDRA